MENDKIIQNLQEQLNHIKETQNYSMGAISENPDISKWEMDPEKFLDNLQAQLLGKTKSGDVWIEDPTKERIMNEFGVSRFIAELESRISIHMQMSELDKQEINEIVGSAGLAYGDVLEDNWQNWGIKHESLSSELMSIGTMFEHNLWILLNIAKNAGMRKHRERRGIKQYTPQAPQPEMAY